MRVKPRTTFEAWCFKKGPEIMEMIKEKDRGNPFTFKHGIEIPARLGDTGKSLMIPMPDQISTPDGKGPGDDKALEVWVTEVWKLLRSQWENTFDGMLYELRESTEKFIQAHPAEGIEIAMLLQCDPKTEEFRCAEPPNAKAMEAFQQWLKEEDERVDA